MCERNANPDQLHVCDVVPELNVKPKPLEWETANSSLLRFEALYLDRVGAKSTLADCLRDGVLRARAEVVFESRERKIDAAWAALADDEDDDDDEAEPGPIAIPPQTWRRSKDWRGDQVDWRWPYNNFSVTTTATPFRRQLLKTVEFFREDVDRIVRKRRLAAGGAPKRDQDWTLFWHNLIDIAKSDRMTSASFQSQAELNEEILEAIGYALDAETIKKPLAQVWWKFVAR